ncbi:hypothetical protein ACHQM5_025270 [Ranunculus cassubicifolius]
MEFSSTDLNLWKQSLSSYQTSLYSLNKPALISLDNFYRRDLPLQINSRNPNPHITKSDLIKLMQWKLSRGKWRPRLLDFVTNLDESAVKSASEKAFRAVTEEDVGKAIEELTVLKGVGPATASAVLAAFAPEIAPFMSDEAMVAALGNSKDYTLKQYLVFAKKLQEKSKELSKEGETFTPSDVEMALWSSAVGAKSLTSPSVPDSKTNSKKRSTKRKRN